MDPFLGRRLARMMREAGLKEIKVDLFAEVYGIDHPRRFTFLTFIDNMRSAILETGTISDIDLDRDVHSLRAHLEDQRTTVTSGFWYQVWGRKHYQSTSA